MGQVTERQGHSKGTIPLLFPGSAAGSNPEPTRALASTATSEYHKVFK